MAPTPNHLALVISLIGAGLAQPVRAMSATSVLLDEFSPPEPTVKVLTAPRFDGMILPRAAAAQAQVKPRRPAETAKHGKAAAPRPNSIDVERVAAPHLADVEEPAADLHASLPALRGAVMSSGLIEPAVVEPESPESIVVSAPVTERSDSASRLDASSEAGVEVARSGTRTELDPWGFPYQRADESDQGPAIAEASHMSQGEQALTELSAVLSPEWTGPSHTAGPAGRRLHHTSSDNQPAAAMEGLEHDPASLVAEADQVSHDLASVRTELDPWGFPYRRAVAESAAEAGHFEASAGPGLAPLTPAMPSTTATVATVDLPLPDLPEAAPIATLATADIELASHVASWHQEVDIDLAQVDSTPAQAGMPGSAALSLVDLELPIESNAPVTAGASAATGHIAQAEAPAAAPSALVADADLADGAQAASIDDTSDRSQNVLATLADVLAPGWTGPSHAAQAPVKKARADRKPPRDLLAAEATKHSPFGQAVVAVREDELGDVRGGFTGPDGLQVSFGIERAVYVNGNLVTTTSLKMSELGKISGGRDMTGMPGGGMTVVQNGAGNTFQTGPISANALGTVIQNTLNDQKIESVTVVNASVNSLGIVRSMNTEAALRSAVIDTLRR